MTGHSINKSGYALIMTLLVMTLLSVVAFDLAAEARRATAMTKNYKDYAASRAMAVSAFEEACQYILNDREPDVDYIDKDKRFRLDSKRNAMEEIRESDGAEIRVNLTDEESRLNINQMNIIALAQLLDYIGVPEDSITPMVDSLQDWKDTDDLHRLSGAEDEYYMTLGYKAKNAPFDVPEELLYVKGYTSEHLNGSKDIKPVLPLITTWGEGVNVNTVSLDMLKVVGLPEFDAQNLISAREAQEGLRIMPPQFTSYATLKSSNFRITATAKIKGNPNAYKITAVVKREFGTDGPFLQIRYWKEDIAYSGV